MRPDSDADDDESDLTEDEAEDEVKPEPSEPGSEGGEQEVENTGASGAVAEVEKASPTEDSGSTSSFVLPRHSRSLTKYIDEGGTLEEYLKLGTSEQKDPRRPTKSYVSLNDCTLCLGLQDAKLIIQQITHQGPLSPLIPRSRQIAIPHTSSAFIRSSCQGTAIFTRSRVRRR
jgi:hypothetical protein